MLAKELIEKAPVVAEGLKEWSNKSQARRRANKLQVLESDAPLQTRWTLRKMLR